MNRLQGEQEELEHEIERINNDIEVLEQEIQEAYREFVEIAAQSESARIPMPHNIANYGFDLVFDFVTDQATPDSIDEQNAWERYEAVKKQNDEAINALNKEIRGIANQVRKLQSQIEAVTTRYMALGCAKR